MQTKITVRDLLKAIADCEMDARIDIQFCLKGDDVVEAGTDYHPYYITSDARYLQIDCKV